MKLNKYLVVLLIAFVSWGQWLKAEEPEGAKTDKAGKEEVFLIEEVTGRDVFVHVLFYLAFFAIVAAVIFYCYKRGNLSKMLRKKDGKLKVSETHMLGNKQFLVVVEYSSQKILLGVGPGMINKLCYLNTPFEEKMETDVDLNEKSTPQVF